MAAPVTSEVIAQEESESALRRVLGVLAVNRNYRSYWIGNQASTLVMQMQMVANGYLAFVLNNAGMNASRVLGPSLAGVLIAVPWFGVRGVYFLRIIAFVWVVILLLQIPIRGDPEQRAAIASGMERVRDFGAQLTSGLR